MMRSVYEVLLKKSTKDTKNCIAYKKDTEHKKVIRHTFRKIEKNYNEAKESYNKHFNQHI